MISLNTNKTKKQKLVTKVEIQIKVHVQQFFAESLIFISD